MRGDGILIIISINVSSITSVQNSVVKCFARLTSTHLSVEVITYCRCVTGVTGVGWAGRVV